MNPHPSAVFLDRDGTIIEDAHYISRPSQVKLIDGAADSIARMNSALIPVIVVTNQSGIGRGMFTTSDYEAVAKRLDELLGAHSARIDATYFCPHIPGDSCACRKPGVGMYRQAAEEHPEIDLARSLYVGDRIRDVEPGLVLGGQSVLVPSKDTPDEDIEAAGRRARVAPSLGTALDWFLCSN